MRSATPRMFWASLAPGQRRTLVMMLAVVGGLHVAGFLTLVLLAGPGRHAAGAAGALSIGVGVTAYTLGLRHAFDADHIAAIDNSTRKLMAEGKRPLSVGFWFSLGHSTIVFALAVGLAAGIRSLAGSLRHSGSALHETAAWIGTLVSGGFLYLIAAINLVVLLGLVGLLRGMRAGGGCDERRLEEHLQRRGLLNRVLGRLVRTVGRPVQMYPIGLLFGLGFDTATEVGLLVLASGAAGAGLPWYGILCLPVLFAAGMSLLDSLDGTFMNFAYGWALAQPVRKLFYNVVITGLSVAVALVIGTIELVGLVAQHLGFSGSFWGWLETIDVNVLGFVLVGLFALAWAIAATVWRFGRIEERWAPAAAGARAGTGPTVAPALTAAPGEPR